MNMMTDTEHLVTGATRRVGEVILDVQNISLSFGGVKALTDTPST